MLTYQDLLDHILAYGGDDATAAANSKHRRAAQEAYRAVATRHNWLYYVGVGRINTSGVYATGTVDFDLTGGANERQLTLAGGTWPTWAADGYVVIGNVPYQVESRVSATVLKLAEATAPVADIAALTEYQIVRDLYSLPADFVSADETVLNDIGTVLEYTHPRDWSSQRRVAIGPGQPRLFTLLGNPASPGTLRLALWPAPDAAYTVDMLYRRRGRAMVFEAVGDGLVTTTADSATIAGSGTAFKAAMVGSVIRLAADNQTSPTGLGGGNPAVYERSITAVASAASITVDSTIPEALDGVRYVVTDPADVAPEGMQELLLRECEKQWRIIARSTNPKVDEETFYREAMTRALEADSRYTGRIAAGRVQGRRSGFNHYPITFGV